MQKYIDSRIKNLRKALDREEKECERFRLSLVNFVGKCTAEEIAHGCLDGDLRDIGKQVEKVKSLREQIELLEYIQENAE